MLSYNPLNIQDIFEEWEKNRYTRYMLTEYGLNYINSLKTPEAWLRFA
ncbi:24207_t:CDS:1, partial [Gigaspora rosea]